MQCRRETRMEHKVYQICFYGFLSLRHSVVGHVSTNHLNKSTCNAQPIVKKRNILYEYSTTNFSKWGAYIARSHFFPTDFCRKIILITLYNFENTERQSKKLITLLFYERNVLFLWQSSQFTICNKWYRSLVPFLLQIPFDLKMQES